MEKVSIEHIYFGVYKMSLLKLFNNFFPLEQLVIKKCYFIKMYFNTFNFVDYAPVDIYL